MLAETTGTATIRYLHGLDLVAQSDGASTAYFAYDGLGSVRQVMTSTSGVLMAQTFDPYGNVYSRSGANESTFGFSGEQTDSNGLVFLRARYYNPAQGRFFQRDTWRGSNQRPQSLNPYSYGLGNPVLHTDPSGHDPWWCDYATNPAKCYGDDRLRVIDVYQSIVDYARNVYSKDGSVVNCASYANSQQSIDSVRDLFIDYICEYGPATRVFENTDRLTVELAHSNAIMKKRAQFYASMSSRIIGQNEQMGIPDFFSAKFLDMLYSGFAMSPQPLLPVLGEAPVTITDFLGGFDYWEIAQTSRQTLRFEVRNRTSLVSGTRIGFNNGLPEVSLEDLLEGTVSAQNVNVISILSEKTTRDSTRLTGLGGGTMWQIFRWEERYIPEWTQMCDTYYGVYSFDVLPLPSELLPAQ